MFGSNLGRGDLGTGQEEGAEDPAECRGPNDSWSSPSPGIEDAEAYVLGRPKRYVSKPNGDMDKKLSYVAKNAADLIYMLRSWEEQERFNRSSSSRTSSLESEMGVGGWFGPDGWSKALCENWEFKKLCNDDLGVATGEMGTVLRYMRNLHWQKKSSCLSPLTFMLLTTWGIAMSTVSFPEGIPSLWVHNALRMAAGEHSNGRPSRRSCAMDAGQD